MNRGNASAGYGQSQAQVWLEEHLGVSRETLGALEAYVALLEKWNRNINLVGPSTLQEIWNRHIVDCAQLVLFARAEDKHWLDMGSGAGLPGLILAILLRERDGINVNLIEPSAKRCAFLREAARLTGAPAIVSEAKIETIAPQNVDVVIARAFTSLDGLLTHSEPWMALGARALFLKGGDVERELNLASTNWSFRHRISPSHSDARGCVLEIEGLSRVNR